LKAKKCNAWHVFNNSPELTLNESGSEFRFMPLIRNPMWQNAPHLLEIANNKDILDVVHNYFGWCAYTVPSQPMVDPFPGLKRMLWWKDRICIVTWRIVGFACFSYISPTMKPRPAPISSSPNHIILVG